MKPLMEELDCLLEKYKNEREMQYLISVQKNNSEPEMEFLNSI